MGDDRPLDPPATIPQTDGGLGAAIEAWNDLKQVGGAVHHR